MAARRQGYKMRSLAKSIDVWSPGRAGLRGVPGWSLPPSRSWPPKRDWAFLPAAAGSRAALETSIGAALQPGPKTEALKQRSSPTRHTGQCDGEGACLERPVR